MSAVPAGSEGTGLALSLGQATLVRLRANKGPQCVGGPLAAAATAFRTSVRLQSMPQPCESLFAYLDRNSRRGRCRQPEGYDERRCRDSTTDLATLIVASRRVWPAPSSGAASTSCTDPARQAHGQSSRHPSPTPWRAIQRWPCHRSVARRVPRERSTSALGRPPRHQRAARRRAPRRPRVLSRERLHRTRFGVLPAAFQGFPDLPVVPLGRTTDDQEHFHVNHFLPVHRNEVVVKEQPLCGGCWRRRR